MARPMDGGTEALELWAYTTARQCAYAAVRCEVDRVKGIRHAVDRRDDLLAAERAIWLAFGRFDDATVFMGNGAAYRLLRRVTAHAAALLQF